MRFDVVIPTRNSAGTVGECVDRIKTSFGEFLGKIVVVDGFSCDDTVSICREKGCFVVSFGGCLGECRVVGCELCDSEYIFFVDSDIFVDIVWFNGMRSFFEDVLENAGMVFGYTLNCNCLDRIQKKYRMDNRFRNSYGFRRIDYGERGYTHNTLIRRDLVLGLEFDGVYSWEDYVITQNVLDNGFDVFEVDLSVEHCHDEDLADVECWSAAGCRRVKGLCMYGLVKPFWLLFYGLYCFIRFRKIGFVRMYFDLFVGSLRGYFFYKVYTMKR